MASQRVRLSYAIDQFIDYAAGTIGQAAGTVASKQRTLNALALQVGNGDMALGLQVWTTEITESDFTATMAYLAKPATDEENEMRRREGKRPRSGRSASALQVDKVTLEQFLAYCKYHRYIPKRVHLLTDVLKMSAKKGAKGKPETVGGYIPYEHWRTALEYAGGHHPMTRVVFAIGLLWGRRVSEMVSLRWEDVDRPDVARFTNQKLGRVVHRAMPADLVAELETWKTWLRRQLGTPDPSWYVVPRRLKVGEIWRVQDRMIAARDPKLWPVDPNTPALAESVRDWVGPVLRKLSDDGMFVCDAEDLKGESTHALRRSHLRVVAKQYGSEVGSTSADHKDAATLRRYTGDEYKIEAHAAAMATFGLPDVPKDDTHKGDNILYFPRRAARPA
jgi:integrase